MLDFITARVDICESEGSVLQFLGEMNLPSALDSIISSSNNNRFNLLLDDVSDNLWRRIDEISQKGGTNYLMGQIANVEKTSNDIARMITDSELMLYVSIYKITSILRTKNKKT